MVLTIAVLAILLAMLATIVAGVNADARATIGRTDKLKAKIAAESGIAYALSILQRQAPGPATQLDEWFGIGNEASDRYLSGQASFRMQIVDAAGLVNLNTATEQQLLNMGLTTEQVDSLLDWREDGLAPRTEGAKDEYYNTLENPYNAKLRRLDSLDELMQVKGFDAATLMQSPEQANSSGVTAIPIASVATVDSYSPSSGQNINAVTQQQLQQAGIPPQLAAAIIARRNQGQFTNLGDVLRVVGMTNQAATVLVNNYQVGAQPRTEGKLNINTASLEALTTIPEITPDVADAIISRQAAGFQNLGELLQVPGITLQTLAATVDRFSVQTDVFLVRIEGFSGAVRYPLEVVVRVAADRPRILKVLTPLESDMRVLWGWADDPTGDITLGS
ncbi:MAG: hypothetical protein HONBIEJF_01252 [Fimbriimonadaceae bacterium]|nr:hypothetical protein [Fimbriimonadaceae bacterium]